jgi:hypothetical protein
MGYKFNPFTGTLDEVSTGGGGSTSPGGSNTQIQFNDSSSFGGDADLVWNKTTNVLGITGDVNLIDGGSFTTTLQTITPTAARTISLPDATGTVALVAGSSGQLLWNNAGVNAGASTLTYDGSILTTSGKFVNSYNSSLATPGPAKAFTGTWFITGGTATTTKPQVLIEPTGTSSGAWSNSGTGLGVNAASGFSGRLLDLQLNGTSNFSVNSAGDVTSIAGFTGNGFVVSGQSINSANQAGSNAQSLSFNVAGSGSLGIRRETVLTGNIVIGRTAGSNSISTFELGDNAWSSTPSSVTLTAPSGTGSNIAGGSLTLLGGVSTGTGNGGSVNISVTPAGSSGTTRNSGVVVLSITPTQLVQFGGATSSFPALKRSSAILQARLADDSGYTTIDAQHRLQGTAPATASDTGTAGDVRYDASYVYICTATNTWKRAALTTW